MEIKKSKTTSWAAAAMRQARRTSGRRCASIASPACCRPSRSARSRSSCESEEQVEVDMPGQMRGEFVERLLDLRVVGEFRTHAEPREPGRALAVVGEELMDVSAHHAAVRRNRAVGPT